MEKQKRLWRGEVGGTRGPTLPRSHYLADHIHHPIGADHKPNKVCGNHHQEIENTSNCADMAIPWNLPVLIARERDGWTMPRQERKWLRLTFVWGRKYAASSSGKMNKLMSHPHASNRKDRSCHSATNEKMSVVVNTTFFVPPSGIYMYLYVSKYNPAD